MKTSSYNRIFLFVSVLLKPFLYLILRFRGERIPKIEGPVFLLCNHNTDLDFLILCSISKTPVFYVATETIARMGIGRFAVKHFRPILHDKGGTGVGTAKEMLQRLKEGDSICLFPEGNRSFDGLTCPVSPSTGKLVKLSGATLVDYRLEGGYLTSPRWGKGFRKGKMRGVLAGIYTPEDLKKMSAAEVQKTIETDLFTDAYEEQKRKPIRFKSKVRAEYLETLLYQCPACKAFGSLHSEGAGLFCSCGYEAEFTEYGMVKDKAGRRTKLTTLVQKQQESLKKSLEETDLLLFQDEVNVSRINEEHMVEKEEKLTLSAYPDRLTLGEETLSLSKISDMAIVQRNKLIIHVSGERVHPEISGDERLNAVKYRDLYRISNE